MVRNAEVLQCADVAGKKRTPHSRVSARNQLCFRDKIIVVHHINLSADELVSALLHLSQNEPVCILDSSGVGHLGSHLLIAGIEPVETVTVRGDDAGVMLSAFESKLSQPNIAAIYTISYDFGLKLQNIQRREKEFETFDEPDIFLALFDCLIIHDYTSKQTYVTGNSERFLPVGLRLMARNVSTVPSSDKTAVTSNFTKEGYMAAVETIKEYIRSGDTYQANLTQQLTAELPEGLTPETIFWRLRKNHPAPFAAFIRRGDSAVVSASPERFIKTGGNPTGREGVGTRTIYTSPIKGTRPRGKTPEEDEAFRQELLSSKKDLAENTMIVDLLRNDLGRVCEFGSVRVEKLCDLEEHPTLFHLVSTIKGELRKDTTIADIIHAVFPCGSITGAPKIRTMQIIDELETANRGLSMGAIGIFSPESEVLSLYPERESNAESSSSRLMTPDSRLDMSVAIRTMVIKDQKAVFNVGGGIVIDSDPEKEYDESLLKAKALLDALGAG